MRTSGTYLWREAARFGRLTWRQFCALDTDEQAAVIAHYQTYHRLQAAQAKHDADEAKRRSRRRMRSPTPGA